MSSLVLKTAGTLVGGAIGGNIGAVIGSTLGQVAGNVITPASRSTRTSGPRLADLAVQTSTYGKSIPVVFGTARLAGNIIWSRPIKESARTMESGGKGGGGGGVQSTSYSYSVSLAIAICEGEITDVLRVWADAKQLDLSAGISRLYKGSETQLPDAFIESFEGIGSTPAYRGLCYVVIEDFPLADYGNRIPNFTFEVKRKSLSPDVGGVPLEHAITAVTMIPGSGEFVYDTVAEFKLPGTQYGGYFAQTGERVALNQHTPHGKANMLVSLDQLKETLPNVEWINVVVNWFGTSLSAGACTILPGVEYATGGITEPDSWGVAGKTRSTAHAIGLDAGALRYGGTPDDQSLIRLLNTLRAKGYKILLTPMFVMDIAGKPWRGTVTGNATDVANFFTKMNGYNAFVTHYATLAANYVDAFAIGSELVGLTRVTPSASVYPGVAALVALAATVKSILATGTKVTYAADWSEYHHTDGGWYHLDPLWASAHIDMVGIDAYFPLSDQPQQGYDLGEAIAGWTEGEGYDWYYSDSGRTVKSPLSPAYAWKNIAWWWSNTHINPNAAATAWVPGSKPIWFTEYGFPSIDGALNQPNVFYDPTSSASAFPYYSKGRIDLRAQRLGLCATEAKWAGSAMVATKFVWTWDARPFPYWPDLNGIWGDGASWGKGHWVQGKLGLSALSGIVKALCIHAGFEASAIDTGLLEARVDGYVITGQPTIRACLEELMGAYFFDVVESDGKLKFVPRGNEACCTIPETDLVMGSEAGKTAFTISRAQEIELPQRIYLICFNRERDYETGTQIAQRSITESQESITLNLPLVLPDQVAMQIAETTLYLQWVGRTHYEFILSTKYAFLEPGDVVNVTVHGISHSMRLISIQGDYPGKLRLRAEAEEKMTYDFYNTPGNGTSNTGSAVITGETRTELLDLPALPNEDLVTPKMRIAACGSHSGWHGAVLYRSGDNGVTYQSVTDLDLASVIGNAVTILEDAKPQRFDRSNTVRVALLPGGELSSVTELALLNGANSAVLGNEILQFGSAALVEPGVYELSNLLRGRLGTENAAATHAVGDRFVLLGGANKTLPMPSLVGLSRLYKPVTIGASLNDAPSFSYSYSAESLKPLAPVHLCASRDGAGEATIKWVRRTRGGGEWQYYTDAPLNELKEAYEVEILNGSIVVRTFQNITSPSVAYSAAQQIMDFGSAQATLSIRVYQLSDAIGRGHAAISIV